MIYRENCISMFVIWKQTSADIGNIFSYTLTDASSLCKFLEKNYQIAKKYHYRARAPLLRQKLICYNLRNTHSN